MSALDTFCHKGGVICISEVLIFLPSSLIPAVCQNQTEANFTVREVGQGCVVRGATRPVMFTTTGSALAQGQQLRPPPLPVPFPSAPGAWFGDSGAWGTLPPQPHPDRSKRVRKQKAREG